MLPYSRVRDSRIERRETLMIRPRASLSPISFVIFTLVPDPFRAAAFFVSGSFGGNCARAVRLTAVDSYPESTVSLVSGGRRQAKKERDVFSTAGQENRDL